METRAGGGVGVGVGVGMGRGVGGVGGGATKRSVYLMSELPSKPCSRAR